MERVHAHLWVDGYLRWVQASVWGGVQGGTVEATSWWTIAVRLMASLAYVPYIADGGLLLKIERWYLNQLQNITTTENRLSI